MWGGVRLKETPSVRSCGACAPAKEKEEQEIESNLFNRAQEKGENASEELIWEQARRAQVSAQLFVFCRC